MTWAMRLFKREGAAVTDPAAEKARRNVNNWNIFSSWKRKTLWNVEENAMDERSSGKKVVRVIEARQAPGKIVRQDWAKKRIV